MKESVATSHTRTFKEAGEIAGQEIETPLLDHDKHQAPLNRLVIKKAGCQTIQKRALILDWSAGTDAHAAVAQDLKIFFRLLQPLLVGTGVATKQELEQLHQDIDLELQTEDFCAFWTFFTVWGQKPSE